MKNMAFKSSFGSRTVITPLLKDPKRAHPIQARMMMEAINIFFSFF